MKNRTSGSRSELACLYGPNLSDDDTEDVTVDDDHDDERTENAAEEIVEDHVAEVEYVREVAQALELRHLVWRQYEWMRGGGFNFGRGD